MLPVVALELGNSNLPPMSMLPLRDPPEPETIPPDDRLPVKLPSLPETLPPAVILPVSLMLPVTVSLPLILTVLPLWLMFESLTFALPPGLENSGTNPVLQAVAVEHAISLALS